MLFAPRQGGTSINGSQKEDRGKKSQDVLFSENRFCSLSVWDLLRLTLGFRVHRSGFKVQGSGFRVWGSKFRVHGSGFRVHKLGFIIQGSGFRLQG